MSRLSPNVRPLMPLSNNSSSLSGMEIATPKSPHRKKKVEKEADHNRTKPLPPTPTLKLPSNPSSRTPSIASSRTPSTGSLSSVYNDNVPLTPRYIPYRRDTVLPSPPLAFEPFASRSSTSLVPDTTVSRPKPRRDAKTQELLQKPTAARLEPPKSVYNAWKPPNLEERGHLEEPRIPTPIRILAPRSREMQHIAEQHADEYKAILPRNSTIPDVVPEPYHEGFNALPGPMSPRITDVVDETCVPQPLRMSIGLDSNASSRFSSSSSDVPSLDEEKSKSFKSRAKKAFHSRKLSQEKSAKKRRDTNTTSQPSNIGERSNATSMTPSERASIQKGIIDMYETLTHMYDPSNKYTSRKQEVPASQDKPASEATLAKEHLVQKRNQSPRLPATPYPKDDNKAEDPIERVLPPPHSIKAEGAWIDDLAVTQTPKKSHFSLSSRGSSRRESQSSHSSKERMKQKSYTFPQRKQTAREKRTKGVKWKRAVGFERKSGKQKEEERRRDDIKKKIVLVGLQQA